MKRQLYQHLASRVQAMENCAESGNSEWFGRHRAAIEGLVKEHMPSGSGFDNGTVLNVGTGKNCSKPNRLVFSTSFHHMNESGMYDGWTEHDVIVTPDLAHDFSLSITGRDRQQIKDHIADTFYTALRLEIDDADARHMALWDKVGA